MKRGYLALWRKIQDHDFYKEKRVYSKYEAWLDLIMEVQHKEEPQQVVIGMKVYVCNYGESLKSHLTWGKRWGWSESKVRRYFKLLKNMGQIVEKSEVKTTRISLINYHTYDPRRRANDDEATSKRRASDDEATTDKNDNNVKNEKKRTKENFIFPESYSEALKSKFNDFIDNRKELKKPVTKKAFTALVEKLNSLSAGNESIAIQILNNSIESGWSGLFQIKNSKGKINDDRTDHTRFTKPGYYEQDNQGTPNDIF